MYTAPNTEVKDDLDAWQTHNIRSHRKPRGYNRLGVVFIAISLVGAGGVSYADSRPLKSPSVVETQAAIYVPLERTEHVSRAARTDTRKQKIERVISYALAQRGDRYRWGATGPSRWDCSGLVTVAFKKGAKKSLPRTTSQIQKRGTKVSKRNLKRGDIIFPQRGHVAIYLGGGKMVAASSGKGKVVVQKVYGFYTARRVL